MARKRKTQVMTPELATKYLKSKLARDIEEIKYVEVGTAQLCTINYVEGPVWAIPLYTEDNCTHWGLLEEITWEAAIYIGSLVPQPIIPKHQTYFRPETPRGEGIGQVGTVYRNKNKDVCIRWKNINA